MLDVIKGERMKKVRLVTRIKWKLMKLMRHTGISWCDWCDMLCFFPNYLEDSTEYVCRHCIDEATECTICDRPTHDDDIRNQFEGDYCTDCWDSCFG